MPARSGPLGIRVEPWGKTGVDEAEEYFRQQAQALVDGGVDLFVLETFRDVNEIGAAIRAVRSVCALPIVAQMTTEEDGNSLDGVAPETFVPDLEARGADVVGLNCSVGPAAMLEALERMARVARVKLAAQPNAGKPREVEGRNLYLSSPEYMASYARRFINTGVRLVGGCCGTTPDHIRAIKVAVRSLAPGATAPAKTTAPPAAAAVVARVPREQKSRMANTLVRGGFVVERRADAAARLPGGRAGRTGAHAEDPRRRPGQYSGQPARERAHERALGCVPDPAAVGGGDDPPLRLPRSQPARRCSRICSARTRWVCAMSCS